MNSQNGKVNSIGRTVEMQIKGFQLALRFILVSVKTKLRQKMIKLNPPVAVRKPKVLETHGHQRVDDYYWLRDNKRKAPEVLEYLRDENCYANTVMRHTRALQSVLYSEIRGRIKEEDMSVPYRQDHYWYYTRYEAGKEYPLYARKEQRLENKEEVLLDVNVLAQDQTFYNIGNHLISPDHSLLAYAEDIVGDHQYTLRIKNLKEGVLYPESIRNVSSSMAWSHDGQYLFYVENHPDTLLPYRVFRHVVGTFPDKDVLIYEESDNAFYAYVCNSRSRDYIFLILGSTLSSEVRLLDASTPEEALEVFLPREQAHEYEVEHLGEDFYIRTNWQAENFRLMKTKLIDCGDKAKWEEVIPNSDSGFLEDFELFDRYLAVNERSAGLLKIRVISFEDGVDFYIEPESDSVCTTTLGHNPSPHTNDLRYKYSSMTKPDCVYEYDMSNKQQVLLKQMEIPCGFDSLAYQSERVWVRARDGECIPVSLVYAKTVKRDGSAPLYLYAYGAYGISIDPYFSRSILSLLDRGFIYAIAHVRGGQELGRRWYDAGRLLNKQNTFTDFIDVTCALINLQYTSSGKVIACGGSAGGLLTAVIANMEAEARLYKAIVADVPFVDVVTSMLDESMPLTAGEYDEWGDPKEKMFYEYILSYSPYDQIAKQDYPHMLITAGLYDSQVQYWEPAKWVAKLRANKTDNNILLLHTNMKAGHQGASGRFEWVKELAFQYAFILNLFDINA